MEESELETDAPVRDDSSWSDSYLDEDLISLQGQRYLYFETLPLHPRPLPLESLTSWLTRIGQQNRFTSISALAKVCLTWRTTDSDGTMLRMADFPPGSWVKLARVTTCPPPLLAGTTFYYLMRNFGRATRPQPVGRFLAGSLATTLRYCPACLTSGLLHGSTFSQRWMPASAVPAIEIEEEEETVRPGPSTPQPYYPLSWRFKMLLGCPLHGCRLLEVCPHCARPLQFLSPTLKMCACWSCGGDLRECGPKLLTRLNDAEWEEARRTLTDLECLLQPQPRLRSLLSASGHTNLGSFLGARLGSLRAQNGIYRREVALVLGAPINAVSGVEKGDTGSAGRGVRLRYYFEYARYMHTSLHDLLAQCGSGATRTAELFATTVTPVLWPLRDAAGSPVPPLINEHACRQDGQQQRTQMGLCVRRQKQLQLMMRVQGRLGEGAVLPASPLEVLLLAVDQAVADLQSAGSPPTQQAVAQLVGYSRGTMMRRPEVRARLMAHVSAWNERVSAQVSALAIKGERQQLRDRGTYVASEHAWRRTVDAAIRVLRAQQQGADDAKARSLAGHERAGAEPQGCTDKRTEVCAAPVEQATVTQPEADAVTLPGYVTVAALSRYLGVSRALLRASPIISERVASGVLKDERSFSHTAESVVRQATLLRNCKRAVRKLTGIGVPVSKAAVSEIVGTDCGVIERYPKVAAFLQQAIAESRVEMARQFAAHEKDLDAYNLWQVEEAKALLREWGAAVTRKAICKLLQYSSASLYKHPRASAAASAGEQTREPGLSHARQLAVAQRRRARECAYLEKVMAAKAALEEGGEKVTPTAIAAAVGRHLTTLCLYPSIKVVFDALRKQTSVSANKIEQGDAAKSASNTDGSLEKNNALGGPPKLTR